MDKLMAHRFWICFGVAAVLIPVGWLMGKSSLAKEIETKTAAIEAANNGIPKGSDHPNRKWIDGVQKRVVIRQNYYQRHARELWEMQRSVMQWPPSVAPAFAKATFFGKGSDENARSVYRSSYYSEAIDGLYRIVDPIGYNEDGKYWLGYEQQVDEKTMKVTENVTGKVIFDYSALPKVPLEDWKSRSPEWSEMWKAQMDVWMLGVLLRAIKRVNDAKRAKSVYDASIRKIEYITLRGGSRGNAQEASSSKTPGEEGQSAAAAMGNKSALRRGRGSARTDANGNGGAGLGGPFSVDAAWLDEIFGKELPLESEKKDGEAGSNDATAANAGAMRKTAGGDLQSNAKRMSPYVDNDPNMPFKTRGFAIQVVMDRMDLPLLIQELTDASESKFPVEILRIQEVDVIVDPTGDGSLAGIQVPGVAAGEGGVPVTRGLGGDPTPMGLGARRMTSPVTPMPSTSPMGMDRQPAANNNAGYNGALRDPKLGYIVIAGLMTIYQPPKEPEKKPEAKASPANATTGNQNGKAPATGKTPAKTDANGSTPGAKKTIPGKPPVKTKTLPPAVKTGSKPSATGNQTNTKTPPDKVKPKAGESQPKGKTGTKPPPNGKQPPHAKTSAADGTS